MNWGRNSPAGRDYWKSGSIRLASSTRPPRTKGFWYSGTYFWPTDYTRLKGIKEWNFGLFEAQPNACNRPKSTRSHLFEDLFVPMAEKVDQVGERMLVTLTEVMEQTGAEPSWLLAISHGGAMWPSISRLLYQALALIPRWRFGNCAICHYHYEQDTLSWQKSLTVDGWCVWVWNFSWL